MRESSQREYEFNRSVSHELRSPIQVAQSAMELLQVQIDQIIIHSLGLLTTINFWTARSQGLTQGVYNWSGVKDFVVQQFDPNVPYINKQNSDKGVWQEFSQTVEAVDTTITLLLYATNPDQGNVNSGDDLYIDNVSLTSR